MADTKISAMTAAVSVADADLLPVVQGGANKRATAALVRAGLVSESTVRTANTILAGPTTGAAAAATFRALVAADIPSLSYQPVDATLTALAALGAGPGFLQVTGQDTFSIAALSGAQVNTALGYTAANAASLASSALSGALPALDGSALTALNPANLSAAVPTTKGGTGLTAIGTALQVLRVNAGATALEFADPAGGISGLTAGVVPVATSGTAIGNSKWTMSGANGGTATLYDSTLVNGVSQLFVRSGAGQIGTPQLRLGTTAANFGFAIVTSDSTNFTQFKTGDLTQSANIEVNTVRGPLLHFYLYDNGTKGVLSLSSGVDSGIIWTSSNALNGTADLGLIRSAPGILKVTDGSTGYGSLRAAALGAETANGAISNVKTISESITLATGGLTTDSTADLLPANSIILAVTARVTTQITATTDWALGDATTATRFATANATLTAGTTAVGLAHQQGSVATDAAGPVQIAAAKLRITCSGANPGAGAVRVTVTYLELTPPTS